MQQDKSIPTAAKADPGTTKDNLLTRLKGNRSEFFQKYGAVVILLALGIILSFATPYFLTASNLMTVAVQTAVVGVLTIGELMVIITGGIDLSVGAVLAFSSVVASMMMKTGVPIPVGALVALAIGAVLGYVNGFVVTKMRVPPFIATLGTLGVVRGAALVVTNGLPVSFLPKGISWFGVGEVVGIPVPVLVMFLTGVIFHWILTRTRLGRYTYAIGSNPEATRLSGIDTGKYTRTVYLLCGLLAGLAGVLLVGRLNSAQPTAANGYELNAIAASVIGGASLVGGVGTVLGAVVGAFIMTVLSNGFTLLGVSAFYQQMAIGAIVVLAVYVDLLQRKR